MFGKRLPQTPEGRRMLACATIVVGLVFLEEVITQIIAESKLAQSIDPAIISARKIMITDAWISGIGLAVSALLLAVIWTTHRRLKNAETAVPAAGAGIPLI